MKMADDLKYEELTYMGKKFGKTFNNDDGSVTKSYKYMFKRNENDKFDINFWGYDNTKGLEHLEEGGLVGIKYVEKENKQGGSPIKLVRWFQEKGQAQVTPKQQEPKQNVQQATQESVTTQSSLNPLLKAFADECLAAGNGFHSSVGADPATFYQWLNETENCELHYFVELARLTGDAVLVKEEKKKVWNYIQHNKSI
jgi:hypothetical protein